MRASAFVVIVLAFSAASAHAERGRLYGFAGGVAIAQDPAEDMGVALQASVAVPVGDEGSRSLLWARGKLTGLFTGDSWAVVPSLVGAAAGRFGPIEISLEGGFHIFGVTRYAEQTNFSIFGVGGGGALLFWPSDTWRVGVRGDVSWLPSSLSSPIDDPAVDSENSFFYIAAMLSVEFFSDMEL